MIEVVHAQICPSQLACCQARTAGQGLIHHKSNVHARLRYRQADLCMTNGAAAAAAGLLAHDGLPWQRCVMTARAR